MNGAYRLVNVTLLPELGRFVKPEPSPLNTPLSERISPVTSMLCTDKVEVAMVDVIILEAIIVDAIMLDV